MNASAVVFYLLSAFILGTGLLAVTTRKIFRSAIWLLFSLTGIAGLYFWLQLEFIAAVQIIVYVGGIVVLIIFSIFLTQQSGKGMPATPLRRAAMAGIGAGFGFALVLCLIHQYDHHYGFLPNGKPGVSMGLQNIGTQMLSTAGATAPGYVIPLELISILLLAAMIGCIVIAIKIKPDK